MNKPHKHAAMIKAWADGAELEFRSVSTAPRWLPVLSAHYWSHDTEYRVKPHKWQKEMDAQAAGKTIQLRFVNPPNRPWMDAVTPLAFNGSDEIEYRIKPPERVVQDVCLTWLNSPKSHVLDVECGENFKDLRNLRITFEDGKLVDAKVL
jgi:hypothetical protein